MNPDEYYEKYTQDIRNHKSITLRELFDQVKSDFGISVQEKEVLKNSPKEMSEVTQYAKIIVANRLGNKSLIVRIPREYMYRTLILKKFPNAYKLWLKKVEAWRMSRLMQEAGYRKFNESLETKEIIEDFGDLQQVIEEITDKK